MSELFNSESNQGVLSLPEAESLNFDSNQVEWQNSGADGFLITVLMEDTSAGIRTWLMKVEAGAFSPMHAHEDIEQIYVLEGTFYDQDKSYGPGEYIVRAPGAMHSAGSEAGAVVMLFYSPAAE